MALKDTPRKRFGSLKPFQRRPPCLAFEGSSVLTARINIGDTSAPWLPSSVSLNPWLYGFFTSVPKRQHLPETSKFPGNWDIAQQYMVSSLSGQFEDSGTSSRSSSREVRIRAPIFPVLSILVGEPSPTKETVKKGT